MRIVYSYYVLDIVHKGHLLYMQNAKKIAGENGASIVGILTNEAISEKKPNKPITSFDERIELARAINFVDVVIPQETYSPLPNLKKLQPDVCIESTSHSEQDIDEVRGYMKSIGGYVIIIPYYPGKSSTNIKEKIKKRNEKHE